MSTTLIEMTEPQIEMTLRQRWSHLFVIGYAIIALVVGVNLRDATLNATTRYVNPEVGITGLYPQSWVIDTDGDYVFRVRDMSQPDFKTTLQVSVLPVNQVTTTRNLIDDLVFSRTQTLSTFSVLSQRPIQLETGVEATEVLYTFVASEQDPFLETFPTVVEGVDVLAIEGGQAIIVSFLSDRAVFDQTYPIFEQFLNDLDF